MKPKKGIHKIYHHAQDYVIITIGCLLYGFGFNGFILSNEIVTGGLSGIGALIYFATNIPVSVTYFLVNVILLMIAYKILGLKFLIKTIFGVIALSLSLSLFEILLKGVPILKDQTFMSIIIGGGICGTGLGLIFSANGSTGGTDIIAAIINKYKDVSIGTGMLFVDSIIIGCSYFLFEDVEKVVFGFVEMGINNYVLDRIINSNRQSVQFFIFSQKYDEIVDRILRDMDRGCTLLDGHGGYSQRPIKVVVLLAKKSESLTVFRLVHEIDPQAFVSQSVVRGVYGEGFDQIKT
ncbi:YitT family protein [Parabacteroides sp. OttesenSCG-928-K15]|nr:YitT family protein [Parabacteroides sp. OttesenSCG-928-K15]